MSPVASKYIAPGAPDSMSQGALEMSPGFAEANEEQMSAAGTDMREAHEAAVFMGVGS
jgi:hypothetical protein